MLEVVIPQQQLQPCCLKEMVKLELISDIFIEAKNFDGEVSKPELENFISTKIDGFVPALASEEDLAVPWCFKIHFLNLLLWLFK